MNSRLFAFSFLGSALVFLVNASSAHAQLNSYIQAVRPYTAEEGEPLIVSAALTNASSIGRVILYYRQLGGTDFRSVEMQLARDSASVMLPANEIAPPFLEVYVSAETRTGLKETFPASNPQSVPARITIMPHLAKDTDVLILSPDVDEPILPEDLYISLSFVYATDVVDQRKTKIFLNNFDLSSRAMAVGDLMIISSEMIPDALKQGSLQLVVQVFDTTGLPYSTLRRSFSIAGPQNDVSVPIPILFNGSAQAESRTEDIKGNTKTYNRFDVRANATYGILKTTANIQLTSEERPENQPQNRYFVGLDAQYVKLGFGDAYPQFPTTLMDGRRVRGVSLNAGYGAFQVAAASGEIVREETLDGEVLSHRRTLEVVRPSFGKGENFQWGFSYLHSKDAYDIGTTVQPRENVVAGTDLYASVDNRRIEWTSQASFSLSNMDISTTQFSLDSIDAAVARGTLNAGDGDNLKRLLPIASKIITFNENIFPLNPAGLSSLAYETALSFNYFNNYLKGTYTFHGNDYMSFGTSSFRNDIQGYNVSDRLRLLNNSLFVTASIEALNNNVSKYSPITTRWNNTTASLSYFGTAGIPDMTVGIAVNTITNDAPVSDTALTAYPVLNFTTNRYFMQSSYAFAWIGQHRAMVSIDYTNADDRSSRNQDMTGFNGMMIVTTVHSPSLESTVGFATSMNALPADKDTSAGSLPNATLTTTLNYSTLTLGMGYKFFDDRMKAAGTLSPSFGAIRRTQLEARLQFEVFPRHIVSAQYRYTVNSSLQPTPLVPHVNDSAFTIAYRMGL